MINIEKIKKRISLIEWDLQNIQNSDMRKRKEAELTTLRSELKSVDHDHLT